MLATIFMFISTLLNSLFAIPSLQTQSSSSVVLDTTSSTSASGTAVDGGKNATSITWKHKTNNNSNQILLVAVESGVSYTDNADTIDSVSYNGTYLKRLAEDACSSQACYNDIWYLVNPQIGDHDVVVNFSNNNSGHNPDNDAIIAGSATFYNVNLSNPFGTVVTGTTSISKNDSNTVFESVTVPSTNTNQLIFDSIVGKDTVNSINQNSGQSNLWNIISTDSSFEDRTAGGSSTKPASSGSTSMGWTLIYAAGAEETSELAVPLNGGAPLATPTPTPSPTPTNAPIFTPTPSIPVACNSSVDLMLINDVSGSMNDKFGSTGTKLTNLKFASRNFADILGADPQNRLGLVTFANTANLDIPLTNNMNTIKLQIDNLIADGGTCIQCAIDIANQEIGTNGRTGIKKVAVLLTDGFPSWIEGTTGVVDTVIAENAALDAAKAGYASNGTTIYTVGLGNNVNGDFLQEIATLTGGTYYFSPTTDQLNDIYMQISQIVSKGSISGFVFNDANGNKVYDPTETKLSGWTIQLLPQGSTTKQTTTSDSLGNFTFTNLCNGNYSVSEIQQSGWGQTLPASINGYSPAITNGKAVINQNFGNTTASTPTPTPLPTFSISGNVFNDTNKDRIKDNGESNYTGGITITSTNGTVTTSNGTYIVSNLNPGTYTVSYTSLPASYFMVYPKGSPPSFQVTVGPGCFVNDSTTGGVCSGGGNVTSLNFAISNSIPWIQSTDLDMRFDNGFTDLIPATANPTCGGANASIIDSSSQTPGIVYSGDSSYSFGQGQASNMNWTSGGLSYPEVFFQQISSLHTAYAYLLTKAQHAGIAVTDLSTVCTLSNCALPANLPNGIYQANGNVTFATNYSFPANKNYLFLINGDLTIKANIIVPNGSTSLFSTSGSIIVDKSVKAVADACPAPVGQIQGTFSADKNFTAQGNNDCLVGPDTMLNVEGEVIVNAALKGGTFTIQRDLCGDNPLFPSYTIKARSDFILNAPTFLMQQNTISSEVAP